MKHTRFIVGDWGTTHLRVYLCEESGDLLDQAQGPGAAHSAGKFSSILRSLTSSWDESHSLPVLLCGMVGSSIGWRPVPAVSCPVALDGLADATLHLPEERVRIVPGLSCRNILGAPDFMRGEETQILGALHINVSLRDGKHLLCMPGTHTKWVLIDNGNVKHFMTVPTGEIYALLCKHSVLVHDASPSLNVTQSHDGDAAFLQGLSEISVGARAVLLPRLFECRSRRLSGELPAADSPAFLSGLLIGADVRDAIELLSGEADNEITVIGNSDLGKLYGRALTSMSRSAHVIAGDDAVRAGLIRIRQLLHHQGIQ